MTEKRRDITELMKSLLIIFVPLITAIITANYQYEKTRLEKLDENFRSIVGNLSSNDREERLSAASRIGTFIKKEGRYFDEAVDILTSKISIESNYNVRNSIIGSLKKIKKEKEYKTIIDKLLTINRNIFIQEYPIKNSMDQSKKEYEESLKQYREAEKDYKPTKNDSDKLVLDNFKKEVDLKFEEYQNIKKDYDELMFQKPMVSTLIAIFLSEKKSSPIENLEFFRSDMNQVVLTDLILPNAFIKWSTFSRSTMNETKFDGSIISETYFTGSNITEGSFVNCKIEASLFYSSDLKKVDFSMAEFTDAFFTGAELTGANFKGAKGLKPIYFYKAYNVDKAKFDDDKFINKVKTVTADEFIEYVNNSNLLQDMKDYLLEIIY